MQYLRRKFRFHIRILFLPLALLLHLLFLLGQNHVILLSRRTCCNNDTFLQNLFVHIILIMSQSHTSKCSTLSIIIILRSVTVHHLSVYYLLPWMELQRRLYKCLFTSASR